MAKAVQCADDLNVSSERFHCVRKQYIFWRFTLSTGHSVYDNVNDNSFENKKVIGRTFLLGMMSFLMYSNRFVNASLSITWHRSPPPPPRLFLLVTFCFVFRCFSAIYNSYSMKCDSGPLRKLYLCLLMVESFHLLFELHSCTVFGMPLAAQFV